jgi:hypothetical protein
MAMLFVLVGWLIVSVGISVLMARMFAVGCGDTVHATTAWSKQPWRAVRTDGHN